MSFRAAVEEIQEYYVSINICSKRLLPRCLNESSPQELSPYDIPKGILTEPPSCLVWTLRPRAPDSGRGRSATPGSWTPPPCLAVPHFLICQAGVSCLVEQHCRVWS